MGRYFPTANSGSQYRRGTIMGLTVAEAFMLVAFVLLMIFLFWHQGVQEYVDRGRLIKNDAQRKLAEATGTMERDELQKLTDMVRDREARSKLKALSEGAVPVAPERLAKLEKDAELLKDPVQRELAKATGTMERDELQKLTDMVRDPEARSKLKALSAGAVPVAPERLKELEKDAELLKDPAQRELAKATGTLKQGELRKLKDLVRNPEGGAKLKALSEGAVPVAPERLKELENLEQRAKKNRDENEEALKLRRALDPDREDSNKRLMTRIEQLLSSERAIDSRLAEDVAARKEFIDDMKRKLGADVKRAGGSIDPLGRIVFPETVVFKTGSAKIPSDFKVILDDICPRWLAVLKNSANLHNIEEIRIEGHSSQEWASAETKWDAWVANLDLSQRRAQSVLTHCLEHTTDTQLNGWARGKMTAIGYSSSRPVSIDRREDPVASRRVVLGQLFDREELIADLGDAGRIETDSNAVQGIVGKAQVIDADTIKVGQAATLVRLNGIDAPELDQPCIAADGSEWACGRDAAQALTDHIAGRDVVCERLRHRLVRLWGTCRIEGDESELNRWVVNAGWAFALVETTWVYTGYETAARMARRGIWSGRTPERPWEWRRNRKHNLDTR